MLEVLLARIRRAGGIVFLGSASGQALDLVSTIILTYTLGLKGFGILVASRAIGGLIGSLLMARSAELLLRYWTEFMEQGRTEAAHASFGLATWLELTLALAGSVIALALGPVLHPTLQTTPTTAALLLFCGLLRQAGLSLVSVNVALFRLKDQYWTCAGQTSIAAAYRLGLLLVLIIGLRHGLVAAAVADGLGPILAWLSGLAVVRFRDKISASIRSFAVLRGELHNVWSFSSMNWVTGTVQAVTAHGAQLTLTGLASVEAVGAFGLARRLASFASFALSPLLRVVEPELFRLAAAGELQTLRRFLSRTILYAVLLLCMSNVGIIVFRREIVRLIGGEEFLAAATGPLVLIILGFSVQFALSSLRPVLLAFDAMRALLLAQVSMAVVLIGCCLALVPAHQAFGAAVALALSYVAHAAVSLLAVHRLIRTRAQPKPPEVPPDPGTARG